MCDYEINWLTNENVIRVKQNSKSNANSKTVPWLSPYNTQRRKLTVFYSLLIHGCTTFISREKVLNENTVRTKGIQTTLYFIMSSTSFVRHCCFYYNMVCINSIVNVKQKQT